MQTDHYTETIIQEKVTCSTVNERNDYGKPKVVATFDQSGIYVWCKYCRSMHFVGKEKLLAAWQKDENAPVISTLGG